MDRRFLLTYREGSNSTFAWFESEDELEEFISDYSVSEKDIFEMVEILDSRDLME